MNLNEKLKTRYIEIIECEENKTWLDQNLDIAKLAHLHLGFVPENYEYAENKILIIGRETKSWNLSRKLTEYTPDNIIDLMDKSKKWLTKAINDKKISHRGFLRFVRKIAENSGENGILWGNIYALSYDKKHPRSIKKHYKTKKEYENWFEMLEKISNELLTAQIQILQPDYIIFCTGAAGIKSRQKYFPQLKFDPTPINSLPKDYLQKCELELDNKIYICYRLHHPTSFRKQAGLARSELIKLLPKHNS